MEREMALAKKRLILFISLTFAITWMIFALIPISGLTYGSGSSIVIVACAMFVPALCNILTRLITKEGFQKMYLRPHFKGHKKDYLLLYFGPTILLLLSAGVYFLVFPGSFDPGLTTLKLAAASSGTAGLSANKMFLISLSLVVFLGPVVNIVPTLGEELGWRGYLLPKLRKFYSDRAAMVITGVIWGIWHAPVIAMGHNYGTGYPGFPWLGILAMVVFCVWLGIIEGYMSIKLESAIPAAMIHSTVNAGGGLPILLAKAGYNPLLGPAVTGVVGGLPFVALAVILFVKAGKGKEMVFSQSAPSKPVDVESKM